MRGEKYEGKKPIVSSIYLGNVMLHLGTGGFTGGSWGTGSRVLARQPSVPGSTSTLLSSSTLVYFMKASSGILSSSSSWLRREDREDGGESWAGRNGPRDWEATRPPGPLPSCLAPP